MACACCCECDGNGGCGSVQCVGAVISVNCILLPSMSDFYYLDILLEKTNESGPEDCDLSPDELKDYILYSLRSLFGEFGASVAVDLLKITRTGVIVRVPTASCVKLRASLTLAAPFRGNFLSVRSFSSSLPGLTANSRTYCHN